MVRVHLDPPVKVFGGNSGKRRSRKQRDKKEVKAIKKEVKAIKKEVKAIKKRAIMTVMFWWLKAKKTLIIVL